MDRRDLLKGLAALSVGAYAAPASAGPCDRISYFGALVPSSPVSGPRFRDVYRPMNGLGKQLAKERKNVFLWKNLEEEIGEIVPHYQGPVDGVEGEGDCVGQAGAMGCDVLAATDIHLRREAEKFVAKASVEMLYSGSRIEIGKAQDPDGVNRLRGRGGSHGGWMAEFLKEFGVLHRLVYKDGDNELDLTGYHPGRSRKYRDAGVPDWLEPKAKEHPVEMFTNVRTGMEGIDAICSGNPVLVCSSYAFHDRRDSNGFAQAYGSERTGWRRWTRVQWWHAMIATGVVFLPDGTIGVLIQNSHGDWIDGPSPWGMPRGSFFVHFSTWENMIKDWFDCWALSSYKGHEAKRVRNRIHKLWR